MHICDEFMIMNNSLRVVYINSTSFFIFSMHALHSFLMHLHSYWKYLIIQDEYRAINLRALNMKAHTAWFIIVKYFRRYICECIVWVSKLLNWGVKKAYHLQWEFLFSLIFTLMLIYQYTKSWRKYMKIFPLVLIALQNSITFNSNLS